MLRVVMLLLTTFGCILSGVAGAIAGYCAELSWPLSEPNFNDATHWGIGAGLLGAGVTAVALWIARRENLWWVSLLGIGITLGVSCVSMWWDVVSSLG